MFSFLSGWRGKTQLWYLSVSSFEQQIRGCPRQESTARPDRCQEKKFPSSYLRLNQIRPNLWNAHISRETEWAQVSTDPDKVPDWEEDSLDEDDEDLVLVAEAFSALKYTLQTNLPSLPLS